MSYETNLIGSGGAGRLADVVADVLEIRYESEVAISVEFYMDESSTKIGSTITLPAGNTRARVLAPLGARGKGFRVKLSASTTSAPTKAAVTIKQMDVQYGVMGSGGDVVS
jgi:hypothetical protein